MSRHALFLAVLFAFPATGLAQEAAPVAEPDAQGARTYTPADFARYAPRNALEMLERVPGFVIRQQVVERGLGQATGNVLLNGQRLSGKSNDVLTQLQRIAAADVVRIELRDGATLDIPGLSGQVANIVTESGGVRGTWRWRPDVREHFTDPQLTRFDISLSGKRGLVDWTLGLDNNASHSGAGGHTDIFDADGTLREQRDDAWTGENLVPRLSASLARTGPTGQVSHLNLSVRRNFYDYVEEGVRYDHPTLPDRERSVRGRQRGGSHELGGDHEFALGGGRLKLIGLDRRFDTPVRDTVLTAFADGRPDEGVRFERDGTLVERIGRAEYRWKQGMADWQVSAEYAFNRLESTSLLSLLDAGGAWQPVPGFGGDDVVQEDRVELMGTYGRPLGGDWALQLSAGGEFSEIEAHGRTRQFTRPKGLVSLAWDASDTLDVNLKLERRVGQLDFYTFLASVDINDDQTNAGNPDLVPPQTTELGVEFAKDLGTWGNTTLRMYAQEIDDIVDTVPIGATGESPGNLDSAQVYGIEWRSSFQLDAMGWRGARLDTYWHGRKSRVRDPLTGEHRPISNYPLQTAEANLRHDIPDTDWAWGAGGGYYFNAKDYRLTEVGRFWEGPVWANVYVERKNWHGLTVRLGASNLADARSKWNRVVHAGRRTDPVDFVQETDRLIGRIYTLTVSGTF